VINEKAIYAANFIRSVYLLIMLDTMLLTPSLLFTKLHPATLHSTSLHLSTLHFLSFKLHPATLHSSSLHFTQLHFTPLHYIFRRFISSHLNFTQLHFTLLHYTCRHFTSSHLNFTQLPHFTALSFGLAPFQFHIVFNKSQPTLFHQPILAVLNNPDRTCLLFGNKPRIKTNKTQFYWIAHRDNFIGEFGLKEW